MVNSKDYKQVDGLGMGLPLSPTLANIKWLKERPESFKPLIYKRYMDDTFALFTDRTHISKFLDYLNSKHENLKFTYEVEINGKLPFLDCLIERQNNKFVSSVYRKPTFTGLGLNYLSYIFETFKLNSVRTLVHRAYVVSSSYINFHRELSFLVEYFFENGFSRAIVYREIRKFLNRIAYPRPVYTTTAKFKLSVFWVSFGKIET